MMSKLYRFDVDYLDEERGIKHIPCDDGDYVLAEDALALQAKVEELTGLLREHLYAPDNQKIREWEDLAKRSRAALKQEDEDDD